MDAAPSHPPTAPSRFEQLFTTSPPLADALLAHLPTSAVFDLYHTSQRLRTFLRRYPLAWRTLSFRLLPPASSTQPDTLQDLSENDSTRRACALDKLLRVIMPYGSRLARLDLDNTSVSGAELYAHILIPQRTTLKHLSVRGCKDVSLKYHILPFLEMELSAPADLFEFQALALESLYVYRCRHHRRRPYLPSSLTRRDSDSQPTHHFIELCHKLGIWTDTAWCPTPGPRCHRRKDYYAGRHGTLGDTEIWVPFDRLWRSQNVIGPVHDAIQDRRLPKQKYPKGRLWEDEEYGYSGEPLGNGVCDHGEGKDTPTHLRRSHTMFVQGFKCDDCGDEVLERCEQCSVRMHCMACRKTLCASCAFDKPLKRKKRRREVQPESDDSSATLTPTGAPSNPSGTFRARRPRNKFWWAPGATRSPNVISETSFDAESSDDEDEDSVDTAGPNGNNNALVVSAIPKLDMHWCCLKPSFSGGGGIAFIGTQCGDNIKAAPLPRGQGFEDASFPSLGTAATTDAGKAKCEHDSTYPGAFDIVPLLEQDRDPSAPGAMRWVSPRSLCTPCYQSTDWRVLCGACKIPLCIDHDIKTLKVRKCGYRNLAQERGSLQAARRCLKTGTAIPTGIRDETMPVFYSKWRPVIARMDEADRQRRTLGRWAPLDRHLDDGHDQHSIAPSSSGDSPSDYMWTADTACAGMGDQQPGPGAALGMPVPSDLARRCFQTPSRALRRSKSWSMQHGAAARALPDAATHQHLSTLPPRWHGCGEYFCPVPRAAGDPRQKCMPDNHVQSCQTCGVHVCRVCVRQAASGCSCRSCESYGFMCPNCACSAEVRRECTWEEEERQREQDERERAAAEETRRAQVRKTFEEEQAERDGADELMGGIAELFAAAHL